MVVLDSSFPIKSAIADENARFLSVSMGKPCTSGSKKSSKPFPGLHFSFIQQALGIVFFVKG
ncbi:hypothetical protein CKA32_003202 [Geitlerinema sp. FC II]|nr:hypothetical protein CKA32_003202 [Geitlerinema sp. FC II]